MLCDDIIYEIMKYNHNPILRLVNKDFKIIYNKNKEIDDMLEILYKIKYVNKNTYQYKLLKYIGNISKMKYIEFEEKYKNLLKNQFNSILNKTKNQLKQLLEQKNILNIDPIESYINSIRLNLSQSNGINIIEIHYKFDYLEFRFSSNITYYDLLKNNFMDINEFKCINYFDDECVYVSNNEKYKNSLHIYDSINVRVLLSLITTKIIIKYMRNLYNIKHINLNENTKYTYTGAYGNFKYLHTDEEKYLYNIYKKIDSLNII
jgi:hypothetical protein